MWVGLACVHTWLAWVAHWLEDSRSEGFSRTGYLLPANGTPRVSPDGESCWDVFVAAAAVVVIWNFRSTFWLGNYIWSLSLWNWALVEALDTLRPGFCTEFRYLSYGQSGLALGAIFGKIIENLDNELFEGMDTSETKRNATVVSRQLRKQKETQKQSMLEAQRRVATRSF